MPINEGGLRPFLSRTLQIKLEGENNIFNCGIVIGVLTGEGNRSELVEAGADIVIDKITDLS